MEEKGKSKTLLMSKLWKLYNQRPCEDRDRKKERLTLVEKYLNSIMKILEAKRGQMENTVPKEGHCWWNVNVKQLQMLEAKREQRYYRKKEETGASRTSPFNVGTILILEAKRGHRYTEKEERRYWGK
jgi:hypothetical protein